MLTVEQLNQYYGGSHTLRGLSLSLEQGKVTTLLGRNGVGKTTLLKCLMGLLPVASGSVKFEGKDITKSAPYARAALGMAYVPQGREIFPRLTVEENLQMGLANGKASRGVPEYIFEMFPVLKDMLKRRGGDLSGGQQQQLAIGRALTMRPKLLILDEPTEGIQPSIIKDIGNAIRKLAAGGEMAILLVEQYYDFAESLADNYAVMSRGEIIQAGPGSEMKEKNVQSLVAI
ncbi:urea ABC transporter ATP-binding subunit UrtE [Uliginosibacterium sp. H1]|uniref:urea ABC transporter ATP-binding subunit UrtE n=1 Tax=Uliginosibacterium sp. H1 TaxID=3114757 RepID=UPI002E17EC76|nr:urea ABC transporter ATP-binding subunit UrtE [Uliginosibacterium sp. H1]